MHTETLQHWQHEHDYLRVHAQGENRTRIVLVLTACMMVAEIIAGSVFNSLALLADGWHMGTHAAAFALALFAYRYARLHARSSRFSFGTGKVSILGGYTSAIILGVVAVLMALEAFSRLLDPRAIQFNDAIFIAVVGLIVNLVSAWLLDGHDHHHGHEHAEHDHHHHDHDHETHTHAHHDHNLRAAYMHVLADALTSVLAIVALLLGKYWGWNWLDPVMGLVGAAIILHWAYGLLRDTSNILLDHSIADETTQNIRQIIESDADNRIADLHVWKVGAADYAAIISLVTHQPRPPQYYRDLLHDFHELSHITVEVVPCTDKGCGSV